MQAVSDVLPDGHAEEAGVLRHDADAGAEPGGVHVPQVHAVDLNLGTRRDA